MELLDLLENKITEMLGTMDELRAENNRLKEEVAALGSSGAERIGELEEENSRLNHALSEEQKTKEAVLARIDGILSRLGGQS